MERELPKIEAVTADGPSSLRIRWLGEETVDPVDMAGRIASGRALLSPLV